MTHSILIPHHNQPESLAIMLDQLAHQSAGAGNLELQVIVVDDSDPGVELPMGPHTLLRLPRHGHWSQHATAINAGMKLVTGATVTLMCSNWRFDENFIMRTLASIKPGEITLSPNEGHQPDGYSTDDRLSDNSLHYSMHRSDWIDWDERFTMVGGTHHIIWWLDCLMKAGRKLRFDSSLGATHVRSPYATGTIVWDNRTASNRLLEALQRGEDPTVRDLRGEPHESIAYG